MGTFWSGLIIDRHVLAAISVSGTTFEVMGGLYLAYDLLGGRNGSLRNLTRTVTYIFIFCLGYSLTLGIEFGIVAGLGLGILLGIEFGRAHRAKPALRSASSRLPLLFGFLRGVCFGAGASVAFNTSFGLLFGLLSGSGLVAVYLLGYTPTGEYAAQSRPRLRKKPLIASGMRGLATGTAGAIAGFVTGQGLDSLGFGLKVGVVVGLVSALISQISPFIEWWTDNIPARRLGVFGTVLLLLGLMLQSIQYWVTILDVTVR